MGISIEEQEVTISFMRDGKTARLYASDSTWITKMNHRVDDNPEQFKLVESNEFGNIYEFPKKFVSIRTKETQGKPQSEEQKAATAERFRLYREQKASQAHVKPSS